MIAIKKLKPGEGFTQVEEKEIGTPKEGEAVIKMLYSSICGTDVHIYKWDEWSAENIKPPHINGHEGVGIVESTGSNVDNVKVGDYVAYETHNYCNNCSVCAQGNTHVCKEMTILGVNIQGVWREKAIIPAKILFKIPEDCKIPIRYCGILEPFGNAEHTLSKTKDLNNKNVLIAGDGPIGLFASLIARARGAKRVMITGLKGTRLNIAKDCGIQTIDVLEYKGEKLDQHIDELTNGEGLDVIAEFSGQPSVLQDAIRLINPGGDINVLSVYVKSEFPAAFNELVFKNINMHFICGRKIFETWNNSFELINSGKVKLENIDKIVTHEFRLEDFEKGFEAILSGEAGKVLLKIASEEELEKANNR